MPPAPRRLVIAVTFVVSLAGAPSARADWVWPVQGKVITPYRLGANPYVAGQHRGIDIAAAVGRPVVAAAGGEVRFAGTVGSSGLTVSIRTADGRFDTSYLHLSSTTVEAGEAVSTGDRIGAVGTSGERSAAAAHLHFGVRRAGTEHAYRDPLSLLPQPLPTDHRRPGPAPAPGPRPFPLPSLPKRAPAPRSVPRATPAPAEAPRLAPAPHEAPRLAPAPREAPRLAPGPPPAPPPAPAPAPAERAAPSPGLDLGYGLACAGLLLAAGVLGLSQDGRRRGRQAARRRPHRQGSPATP